MKILRQILLLSLIIVNAATVQASDTIEALDVIKKQKKDPSRQKNRTTKSYDDLSKIKAASSSAAFKTSSQSKISEQDTSESQIKTPNNFTNNIDEPNKEDFNLEKSNEIAENAETFQSKPIKQKTCLTVSTSSIQAEQEHHAQLQEKYFAQLKKDDQDKYASAIFIIDSAMKKHKNNKQLSATIADKIIITQNKKVEKNNKEVQNKAARENYKNNIDSNDIDLDDIEQTFSADEIGSYVEELRKEGKLTKELRTALNQIYNQKCDAENRSNNDFADTDEEEDERNATERFNDLTHTLQNNLNWTIASCDWAAKSAAWGLTQAITLENYKVLYAKSQEEYKKLQHTHPNLLWKNFFNQFTHATKTESPTSIQASQTEQDSDEVSTPTKLTDSQQSTELTDFQELASAIDQSLENTPQE